MAVLITIALDLKPEGAEDFMKYFEGLLEDTSKRDGFISIRIDRNMQDPNRIILIEEWNEAADYEAYVAWRTERGDMETIAAGLIAPPTPEFWNQTIARC
ncbi:MAG: antibiotic biosynthesis monooxygenase family protein [Caenibius sp.]